MTLEACFFTEKCQWCKQLIKGQAETDREFAKKDFVKRMKEHFEEKHRGIKCKVIVCCYCDKVLTGWSKHTMKHARRELWRRIEEHRQKYHADKITLSGKRQIIRGNCQTKR